MSCLNLSETICREFFHYNVSTLANIKRHKYMIFSTSGKKLDTFQFFEGSFPFKPSWQYLQFIPGHLTFHRVILHQFNVWPYLSKVHTLLNIKMVRNGCQTGQSSSFLSTVTDRERILTFVKLLILMLNMVDSKWTFCFGSIIYLIPDLTTTAYIQRHIIYQNIQ